MGVLNRMFGGAQGVRETVRFWYANHDADAASGKIRISERPEVHFLGLYAALSKRYWARGLARSEARLMAELAPFCAMRDKKSAIAMLAEYVVYLERPADAEVGILRTVLNATVRDIRESPWLQATVQGVVFGADWVRLLDAETVYMLRVRFDAASEVAGAATGKSSFPVRDAHGSSGR